MLVRFGGFLRRQNNILIISYAILVTLATASADKLSLVHVIWRHGDRNPVRVIPTDHENGESTWPNGLGELTKLGSRQQFELGKLLRKRYITNPNETYAIVSPEYNASQIYVRSTDYNRTLMSAASNLAGFYPVNHSTTGLPFQPVPIHAVGKKQDYLLRMTTRCPKYSSLRKQLNSADTGYQKVEKENKDFINFLRKKSGIKFLNLRELWRIKDPLFVEKVHNDTHKWPSWVNNSIYKKLMKLNDISTLYLYKTVEMAKLRGGPLLTEIVERMKKRSKGTLDQRLKYVAYSAHDMTTAAFLSVLKSYPGRFLGYASCVTLELWEKDNHDYYVRVFYRRNHTEESLDSVKLNISGCSSYDCPLTEFIKRSEPYSITSSQVNDECFEGAPKPKDKCPSSKSSSGFQRPYKENAPRKSSSVKVRRSTMPGTQLDTTRRSLSLSKKPKGSPGHQSDA